MGYKYSCRAKGNSEELRRGLGAGRAPGSTWRVINSSLIAQHSFHGSARKAQGASFHSEPHHLWWGFVTPTPKPARDGLQENTSLAEQGREGLDLSASPKLWQDRQEPLGSGGGEGAVGGEKRGGGSSSAAAQPRDEWSLCAAAAAPFPRQPSAEEGTGPTPLPLPHPPHPGPSVRCLLSGTPARTRSSANNSGLGAARSPKGGFCGCVRGVCHSGVFP